MFGCAHCLLVLVTPEQCRAPSKDEVELFEWMLLEAELAALLHKLRRYNTQNGFIDERGPGGTADESHMKLYNVEGITSFIFYPLLFIAYYVIMTEQFSQCMKGENQRLFNKADVQS